MAYQSLASLVLCFAAGMHMAMHVDATGGRNTEGALGKKKNKGHNRDDDDRRSREGFSAPGFRHDEMQALLQNIKNQVETSSSGGSSTSYSGGLREDLNSSDNVFYDAESVFHGSDFVVEAAINEKGNFVLSCPLGYSVSVQDASVTCGNYVVDFRLKAWDICRLKDTCSVSYDDMGYCSMAWEDVKLTAVCTKVRIYDCFLFRPVDINDAEYCEHVCMNFSKKCKGADVPLAMSMRLDCMTSYFKANKLDSKCAYVFEGMDDMQAEINNEGSGHRQYEMGKVEASNVKWTEVRFRKRMDDPVVFTSLPLAEVNFIYMSITDVTPTGFRILAREWICNARCRTLETQQMHTVQWLAINRGDHSQNLDDGIYAGVLDVKTSGNINLPIDPNKSWSVLVQIQERPLALTDILDILNPALVIPVLYEQREGFHVKLLYSATEETKFDVKLGYLAVHQKETNDLYGLLLKPFAEPMGNFDRAEITLPIPNTWPEAVHTFGSVMMQTNHLNSALRFDVCSLLMNSVAQDAAGADENTSYNLKLEFKIEYLTEHGVRSNPSIVGFVIQDKAAALREKICRHATRMNSRSSSQMCHDLCVGPQGIIRCIYKEDVAKCFEEISQCILRGPHMQSLLDEYSAYIVYLEADAKNKGAAVAAPNAVEESRGRSLSAEDSADPPDSALPPDSPPAEDDRVVVDRDCIEGPWGEWSSCSHLCHTDTVKAKQRRRRQIYADKLGSNSRPCLLVDSRTCEGVPHCSEFCYSREGSGDEQTFQQRFYYIWSDNCRNPNATSVVEKESFGYTGGSQFDTVVVTRMGIPNLLPRSPGSPSSYAGDSASGVDSQCIDATNWSKCNAPCFLETRDQAIEYLRAPIKCLDHRRPCTTKLAECPSEESLRAVEEFGSCSLTHTFYDPVAQSWTRDGACVCEGGVACTPQEVYVLGDIPELIATGSDTHLEHVIRATPFQPYISLADNHRIEMPAEMVRDVTYGLFKPGEVANFCATGSPEIPAFDHKLIWVDCSLAVSSVYGRDPRCSSRCALLRQTCHEEIPREAPETIGECVKARLSNAKDDIYVLNFKHHKCTSPVSGPGVTAEEQVCNVKSWLESTTQMCTLLCRRMFNMCKIKSLHAYEENVRRCMLRHAQMNDVPMADGTPMDFNVLCTYKHTKLVGGGLVYCKKRKSTCTSEGWEPWSDCSASCITLRDGTPVVPTRQRKRKQSIVTPADHANCVRKGIKFYEEVPCLWLPQCADDPSIHAAISKTRARVAWDVPFDTPWNLQSWLLKDARDGESEVTEDHMCQLFSGQRDISNNKIIYQKSRCSCPRQMTACTVLESIHSSGWFSMLQLLCQEDSMRSVMFRHSKGYYRYSCLSRTFLREDFEAHKELCNEGDGTSFVSCQGPAQDTHVYVFSALSLVMGALTAVLVVTYTRSRSSLL
ncbi:hypothetical protein, conserved [Babesia bigemina]|uniref:Thrombospondin type 1 domain containing protein n=1 Tax=Babesia bigemina TaxID=5866 RepID=A0A061D509_BABBI|nr:hypothetical protein, conserved [Babesia bigemina]CDR94049.1 hypothetical protein, conserved [Babesia bigemina]|eukprot:XP_012766235.1 hypothetical protein, conserved [Babesia bigemina]